VTMINGERVRQIRELLNLTQKELAGRINVAQAAIAKIESGELKPSEPLVRQLALATGFPVEFFRRGDGPDFPLGSLLFRAHATATIRSRTEAYRYAQLAFEMAQSLAQRVNSPSLRLPRLSESSSVAATITRAQLGFPPDTPIPNLIKAAELAGVLILNLPIEIEHRDAFSHWVGEQENAKPVICVSGGKTGDRRRWSVAHEIGHLVMHHALHGQLADIEKEANRFAAELLLPEEAMRREIVPPVSLLSLSRLKPRWKVAIQALTRRCYELEIISRRQYGYLFEQISARGWRLREPANLDVPIERPRGLRKMAELLYGLPINFGKLARELDLPTSLVRTVLEAHAEKSEFAARKLFPNLVSLKRSRNERS
jgi:Zn-dependent peptidase ImmA (M78 family)/transcriptional regulator with XRE-family HTH domain